MTTLTLHKLPEGFIVTSDEHWKTDDSLYDFKDNLFRTCKISHFPNGKEVKDRWCKRVIAQQDQIIFNLSEEEQKTIGWFDVEKLSLQDNEFWRYGGDYDVFETGFKAGFQKAQELLSDRKFTLEEMKKAYNKGRNHGASYKHQCGDYDCIEEIIEADKWSEKVESEFIQFLSQPKTWDIELEMEDGGGYREDSMKGCWIPKWQPKLTNGKIKITKLL